MPDLSTEEPAPLTSITITVGPPGKRRDEVLMVAIPADYVVLKELRAYAATCDDDEIRLLRCASAILALCCPSLGRMLGKNGIKYDSSGYDVGLYGRAAYRWIHEQGVEDSDVFAALRLVPQIVAQGWPDATEVVAALGKSGASGAG
jgi:hypothetical protein